MPSGVVLCSTDWLRCITVLLFGVAHQHGGSSALTILITVVVVIIVLVLRGGMLLRLLIRAWAPRGNRHD